MSNNERVYMGKLLAGVIPEVRFVSTSRDYLRITVNKIGFGLVIGDLFPNNEYEKGGYYHIQNFTLGDKLRADLAHDADQMLVDNVKKVNQYLNKLMLRPWVVG